MADPPTDSEIARQGKQPMKDVDLGRDSSHIFYLFGGSLHTYCLKTIHRVSEYGRYRTRPDQIRSTLVGQINSSPGSGEGGKYGG